MLRLLLQFRLWFAANFLNIGLARESPCSIHKNGFGMGISEEPCRSHEGSDTRGAMSQDLPCLIDSIGGEIGIAVGGAVGINNRLPARRLMVLAGDGTGPIPEWDHAGDRVTIQPELQLPFNAARLSLG